MNIDELDKFQITKAINFNTDLNPQLFVNEVMRPEVHQTLIGIADHFREFLGVELTSLVDITLTGSNAAYSYTPHSDVDLHLIVDFSQLPDNDVYRELFDSKKYQYNDQHDIKIKGYDVELYVQDAAQPHVSLGNYSVFNNEWNRFPTKQRANVDEEASYFKYNKLKQLAIRALAADNRQYLDDVLDIVKRYRRAGLSQNGEFGPENLAFKMLRKDGYFEKLWAMKRSFEDEQLSLEHVDTVDTDLEQELAADFSNYGQRTAEDVIKELYAGSETLFDDYDYDTLHERAGIIATMEAAYSGNLGAMEVMAFYRDHPEMVDDLSNLLALKKFKEAWELIQRVTGIELVGKEFHTEDDDSYQPPSIEVGDEIKVGKFKNRKATVKGFETDKDNQPVLKTTKGDHKLFKPRISKLENELEEGVGIIVKGVNTTDDVDENSTKREAAKLGLTVDKGGIPPTLKSNGSYKTVSNITEGTLFELDMSPSGLQKQVDKIVQTARPVIGLEFEVCIEADEFSNPKVTEDTTLEDLQYWFENPDDDEVWSQISNDHMEWISGEKEPEWVEDQLKHIINVPYYNDDEKIEAMVNMTTTGDMDDIIIKITGDEDDIEITEEMAKTVIQVAQEAYKEIGAVGSWPIDANSPPYLALYYEIFIEDADEAVQPLRELVQTDFWESEFPSDSDYSLGSWFIKDTIRSFKEIGREYDGRLYSEHSFYQSDYTSGSFDYDTAQNIASKLEQQLGHEVAVIEEDEAASTAIWNITMDSSIKPNNDDDVGMEIIMPPTEYEKGITDIEDIMQFLRQEGGYANESTGLHINVSMKGIDHSKLDYAKLVLMVGDNKVARQFDREYSEFAENSLTKLSNFIDSTQGYEKDRPAKAKGYADMMARMHKDLSHSVMDSFENIDFGKFSSVGIKEDRIEFRAAGGADYLNNFSDILHVINRFVVAYAVAADPQAHRKEYAKKLYKLATNLPTHKRAADKTAMTLFAAFNAGMIDKDQLIVNLKKAAAKRAEERAEAEADAVDTGKPGEVQIPSPKDEREAIEMLADRHAILDMQAEMRWMEGMEVEMGIHGSPKPAANAAFKNLYMDIGHYN